ncbi:hypothetical protein IE53DRAFT_113616 [Violaceomyces palustris]|uniref:Uncharacterized protein n=1 Tax=Violaceomyces palustris TaxID=1673888 RepID=A0ACD0NW62_9BASI|nr:hypothetical protein IE53DRAFT_113616 [Violaceomyces palustris]
MDAAALAELVEQSTSRLAELHQEIGHPQSALELALESLHQTLRQAANAQLEKVQQEVERLRQECQSIQQESAQIKSCLGERRSQSGSISSSSSSSSSTTATATTETANQLPLLQRKQHLTSERQRLRSLYASRLSQCDRLLSRLDSYRPILNNFVKIPPPPPAPVANPESDVISSSSAASTNNPQSQNLRDVSQTFIASIEAEILRCSKELTSRSERLQSNLLEIAQLWSELCIPPLTLNLGDQDEVGVEAGGTLEFDAAILRHLQLRPILGEGGAFQGDFVSTSGQEVERGGEGNEGQDEEEEDGDRTVGDPFNNTPTRASLGGVPATRKSDCTLRIPSSNGGGGGIIQGPDHILEPSDLNLSRAETKRLWLEGEKERREVLIQDLYDELSELWMKFDVPEEEMDAFVMDHRGSTLDVIEAYNAELEKMKSLKAQHMSLFILKTRERIWTLWDSLFLSEEERRRLFPPYFIDVGDQDSTTTSTTPLDELLASHEETIDLLTEQVRVKAPVLKVIGKYKELCLEGKMLDESAADGSRLLGRGNRGDPGRLLREEKMRKRVKVQKPKLEAELLRVIPQWEEEHGIPFTINGARYLDELVDTIEDCKENSKKRVRTASNASRGVNGVMNHPQQQQPPLSTSQSTNRNLVTPTPMKASSQHSSIPSTTKKPRIASNASVVSTTSSSSSSFHSRTPAPSQRYVANANGTLSRSTSSVVRSSIKPPRPPPPPSFQSQQENQARNGNLPRSRKKENPTFAPSSTTSSSPSRIPLLCSSPPPTSTNRSTSNKLNPSNLMTTKVKDNKTVGGVDGGVQRRGFKPRPSVALQSYYQRESTLASSGGGGEEENHKPNLSPGRASKWGEMGPPRWPSLEASECSRQVSSSMTSSCSMESNVTTLIHSEDSGNRKRRPPSLSLQNSLETIRQVVTREEEGEEEEATKRKVGGWKNGLAIVGGGANWAVLSETEEEESEVEEVEYQATGSDSLNLGLQQTVEVGDR